MCKATCQLDEQQQVQDDETGKEENELIVIECAADCLTALAKVGVLFSLMSFIVT